MENPAAVPLIEALDELERLRAIADEKQGVFSDFTLMPFGEHRNKMLADVPERYLRWWLGQNPDRGVIQLEVQCNTFPKKAIAQQKLKLHDYLKARFDKSTTERKDQAAYSATDMPA
jgi:uncharacterized protein (DUF3820 family)